MKKCDLSMIRRIIECSSVDINVTPSSEDPLLITVCQLGKIEVVHYLLSIPGIDVNIRDKVSLSLLHVCCMCVIM